MRTARAKQDSRDLSPGNFADLFAGCGGLSLGLMASGWSGLFAVEQDDLAFQTLQHNLIDGHEHSSYRYDWPSWLEKLPAEIGRFIRQYKNELSELRGSICLLAGGPPCQGFSLAGQRKSNDPRNELFKHYVALVEILQPRFLLLENVKGISVAFRKRIKGKRADGNHVEAFSERIKRDLQGAGYSVFARLIRAVDIGVPQLRPRYILLAIRSELLKDCVLDPFHDFEDRCRAFRRHKGLPTIGPISVRQAISDLTTLNAKLQECIDSPGFSEIVYKGPRSAYQKLLHRSLNGIAPNSLRLARHGETVQERFSKILSTCRKGVQLNAADRKRFGLSKHCVVPLHPDKPSHTLTSLPDDLIHYSEPRILTVREYARLQSFPDWYAFRGKYTTGGDRRLQECPRYTQAANAVPPFLAEFLGKLVADCARSLADQEGACRRT